MIRPKKVFWILIMILLGSLAVADKLLSVKKDVTSFPGSTLSTEDQNIIRKKYGVPIIEQEWVLTHTDSNYLYWTHHVRGVNTSEPLHLSKTIRLEQGEAIIEEDDFHFEYLDSIAFRLVLIHRYEKKGVMNRHGNEFITYYRGKYPPSSNKVVPNEFADSVLHKWNLVPGRPLSPDE